MVNFTWIDGATQKALGQGGNIPRSKELTVPRTNRQKQDVTRFRTGKERTEVSEQGTVKLKTLV